MGPPFTSVICQKCRFMKQVKNTCKAKYPPMLVRVLQTVSIRSKTLKIEELPDFPSPSFQFKQ